MEDGKIDKKGIGGDKMKEYIEREAANEVCRECVRKYPNSFYNGIEAVRSELRKLTAADVRPVVNTCETCGHKTEQIRVKPYDGACWYWKLHSIKNEEWCCHWKQREESCDV